MMPFYPYYYKQLSEGGTSSHSIASAKYTPPVPAAYGKKFRPGYRNRYTTGVRAFEWDKNRYKVYGKDGKLLCDAIFGTDGIIEDFSVKRNIQMKHILTGILWKKEIGKMAHLKVEFYAMNTKGL